MILQAGSKSVYIKISEIKYKKNTSICKTPNAVDPAKHNLKQMRIELEMLNFHPGAEQALLVQFSSIQDCVWWDQLHLEPYIG